MLSARGHFITILDAYRDKRSLTFEGDFERYGLFSTVIFPSGSTTAILVLDCWNMSAMLSDTSFPLYVFEKDDWSMFLVEREEKLLYHIEPIDFENDEYLFWDAQGRGVRLTLERGALTNIELAENAMTVQEAFAGTRRLSV